MSESQIKTIDDLQRERSAMLSRSTPIGCAIIAIATITVILATVLPFNIPARNVPVPINWFWNPYGLIFLIGMAGIGLLRLVLVLTKVMRHAPIEQAIGCYDAAIKSYAKWQKKGSKENLLRAHELLIAAGPIMNALEEYQRLISEVEKEYEQVFKVQN